MKIKRISTTSCYRCRQTSKKLVDLYWLYDWAPCAAPRVAAYCPNCTSEIANEPNIFTNQMELVAALVARELTKGTNTQKHD
jgi:hypothetical protein